MFALLPYQTVTAIPRATDLGALRTQLCGTRGSEGYFSPKSLMCWELWESLACHTSSSFTDPDVQILEHHGNSSVISAAAMIVNKIAGRRGGDSEAAAEEASKEAGGGFAY